MQKKPILLILTTLFLTIAATPRVLAQPTISLNPVSGPVGSPVTVDGSGFTPDTDVILSWNMSVTGDFVGVGNNKTTEFPLFFGLKYIIPYSEKIYVDSVLQTRDVDYTIDYYEGVLNFTVAPQAGMLQPLVITADYDIMIILAMATTDGLGNFTTTFTVPESYAGAHDVWAVSNEAIPDIAIASFTVESQIALSSTKGPPQAWVTVTGSGFAANEDVDIFALILGHPDGGTLELSYAHVVTDAYGTFAEAIALVSSFNVLDALMGWGNPAVPIVIGAADYAGNVNITFYIAVLLCESEPSKIDVDVEVGEIYFIGEVLTAYALTSIDGVPTDVDYIEFWAYHETMGPMLVSQILPIVHVDTGLYAVTTTLMEDTELGNFLVEVKANKTTYWYGEQVDYPWWDLWYTHFNNTDSDIAEAWIRFGDEYEGFWPVVIHGAGIEGFLVSPTLMGMNARIVEIEGDIATINTNIGVIQLDLTEINAALISIQDDIATLNSTVGEIEVELDDINAILVALDGTIATIETDVGTIRTDISNIQLAIISIEDDTATIDTTLGTIQGRIVSIDGNTATIETDVGTVKADISDVKGNQESFTIPLSAATVLALLAALGTIILLVMHLRH